MLIGLKNLVLDLVLALQNLLVARLLPFSNDHGVLLGDVLRFISLMVSNELCRYHNQILPCRYLNSTSRRDANKNIRRAGILIVTFTAPGGSRVLD